MTVDEKIELLKSCDSLYQWFGNSEIDVYIFHDKDSDAGIIYGKGNITYASKKYGLLHIGKEECDTSFLIKMISEKAKLVQIKDENYY